MKTIDKKTNMWLIKYKVTVQCLSENWGLP